MELSALQTLAVRRSPKTLTVTMHRPERQNSISVQMLDELLFVLREAESDAEVRVIVLQGENGVFSTGMDLEETSAAPAAEQFMQVLSRLASIPRIVVASVDGRVLGGGVGLVAAADLVVATSRSDFGLPEALWGLLPCCVLPYLIRRTGFQPAYRMALTTRNITAAEAVTIHLVDEVSDSPVDAIRQLVLRSTRVNPDTIGALKRYMRGSWIIDEAAERRAIAEISRLAATDQARESVAAFLHQHHSAGRSET